MNDELLDYFFFFLIRDALPAGVIAEALQKAEHCAEHGTFSDTEITDGIFDLAYNFTNRFLY